MFTLDSWSADNYDNLTEYLKSNADLKYRDFHSSLVPDTESNSIIGIRMPIMRKIAKEKQTLTSEQQQLLDLDVYASDLYNRILFSKTGIQRKNEYRQPLIIL